MLSDLSKNPRFNVLCALLVGELIFTPSTLGLARYPLPYRELLTGISEISLGITILALTFIVAKGILRKEASLPDLTDTQTTDPT